MVDKFKFLEFHIPKKHIFGHFIGITLFLLFILWLMLPTILHHSTGAKIVFGMIMIYIFLLDIETIRIPYLIVLRGYGEIEFKGFLNHKIIKIDNIKSIKPFMKGTGYFFLSYKGGFMLIIKHFDEFEEFMNHIYSLNPMTT